MGFSDRQTRALQRRIALPNVRTRVSDGKELAYVEGWFIIAEANRIFGFDSWDRETIEAKCVQAREARGSVSVLYTARVRVTVRSGAQSIVRDGCGTGEGRGSNLGEAHDLALKAAETDATKRALVTFGKAFGLALYSADKRESARPGTQHPRQLRPGAEASPQSGLGGRRASLDGDAGDNPAASRSAPAPARLATTSADEAAPSDGTGLKPDFGCNQASWDGGAAANTTSDQSASRSTPLPERLSTTSGDNATSRQHFEPGSASWDRNDAGRPTLIPPLPSLSASSATNGATPPHQRINRPRFTTGSVRPRGQIDKSALALGEPRRIRDKDHLRRVASQPCLVCGAAPADAHHIRFAQPKALGRKVSDEFTVPLCRTHHRELHHTGNERAWWHDMGLDPLPVARRLWDESYGCNADAKSTPHTTSMETPALRTAEPFPRVSGALGD
jgi:hypothetical protein